MGDMRTGLAHRWRAPIVVVLLAILVGSIGGARADVIHLDGDTAAADPNIHYSDNGAPTSRACNTIGAQVPGEITVDYNGNAHFSAGEALTVTFDAPAGITASATPTNVPSDWGTTTTSFTIPFTTTVVAPDGNYQVDVTVAGATYAAGSGEGSGKPQFNVSVDCGITAGSPLTAVKTATPGGGDFSWDLSKTVDTNLIKDPSGSGTFNYTVTATKGAQAAWTVSGNVTVTNPNADPVTGVNVTDDIGDPNATCVVTDGSNATVPSGDTDFAYTCTYSAAPATSPETNTATVTWPSQLLEPSVVLVGGTVKPTATATFSSPGNDCVTVNDDLEGTLGTPCETTDPPYTYSQTYTADDGTCNSVKNTASLDPAAGSTEQSQTVKVCKPVDLTVSKTVDSVTFTRTYNWSLSKAVDKALIEKLGGGTAGVNYTVKASETGFTDSGWQIAGKITVANPNDFESITADVTDTVDNGGTCTVTDGTGVAVAASGSKTLDYSCTYSSAPSPSSGTNTAKAAWNKTTAGTPDAEKTGTATFDFASPTTVTPVHKNVTITDTNQTLPLGTLTATDGGTATPFVSATYNYSKSLTVPANGCTTYPNTATLKDGTTVLLTASKSVETCGPARTGALTIGYWQNKNGQAVLTGAGPSTGTCSDVTFIRTYAPFQDLSSTATCAQVATYVYNIVKAANASGASMNAMLKAQMLSTALDVYFSTSGLGSVRIDLTHICKMADSSSGGSCTSTFEDASPAFDNPSTPPNPTVLQLLTIAASHSNAGGSTWYTNNKATQQLAKDTFDAINNQVAFSP